MILFTGTVLDIRIFSIDINCNGRPRKQTNHVQKNFQKFFNSCETFTFLKGPLFSLFSLTAMPFIHRYYIAFYLQYLIE